MGALILFAIGACDQQPTAPSSTLRTRYTTISAPGYLIDTGPGGTASIGSSALFAEGATNCQPFPACSANLNWLAGKFTLANNSQISSVEGWMSVGFAGTLAVHIREDSVTPTNLHIPGPNIYSQTYSVGTQAYGWKVFSDYNVNLDAGTYWLTFEPVANGGFSGGMIGPAANPLGDYAFFNEGNNRWVPYSVFNQNPAFGLRLYGTTEVPESSTTAEMIADLKSFLATSGAPRNVVENISKHLDKMENNLDRDRLNKACKELDKTAKEALKQPDKKLSPEATAEILAQLAAIEASVGCD